MNLRTLCAVALLCLGSASSALCATLQVTESGTFGSNTPATMYTAPGGTFSFSFQLDSSPTVNRSSADYSTNPVFQNFQYLLNGAPATVAAPVVSFRNSAVSGGLYLCFNASCYTRESLFVGGAQAYTGTEANPSFQTGSFSVIGGSYGNYPLASASNITIAAVATTPEPSSLLLLSTGVLGVAGVLRRKLA